MSDDIAFPQVDDSLGDPSGVVADAFEVARDVEQPKPVFHAFRLLSDRFSDAVADRPAELVDVAVSGTVANPKTKVKVGKLLETAGQNLLNNLLRR